MTKYKIMSKDEGYTGQGASISFLNGEATTEDILIANWHERKGYEVIPEEGENINISNLEEFTVEQLKLLAEEKGIEIKSNLKKSDIIELLGAIDGE